MNVPAIPSLALRAFISIKAPRLVEATGFSRQDDASAARAR